MKAVYAGTCVVCSRPINTGDYISPGSTGEWVHSRCISQTCKKCYMVISPAGKCGCSDD